MKTSLAPTRKAPREAREFVRDHVTDERAQGLARLDDVLLVVSELVTNAVQAGAKRIVVELELGPQRLVLTVVDDATGQPHVKAANDSATNGRGLALVDSLADTWVVKKRGTGKGVTATWRR